MVRGLKAILNRSSPGAYGAMALVFVALTAAALVADRIPVGPRITIGFDGKLPVVLLAFAIVSGADLNLQCGGLLSVPRQIDYPDQDRCLVLLRFLFGPLLRCGGVLPAAVADRCGRGALSGRRVVCGISFGDGDHVSCMRDVDGRLAPPGVAESRRFHGDHHRWRRRIIRRQAFDRAGEVRDGFIL